MDHAWIDTLAKTLGTHATRRLTVGAILAGVLGFHGVAEATAKGTRHHGRGHTGGNRNGADGKDGSNHKRRDRERQAHSHSTEAEGKKKKKICLPCKKAIKGKCKGTLPDGTPCSGGTCQSGSCVAVPPPAPPGGCTTAATCPAPPAAQLCAEATCFGGQCGFGPKPANTVCRPAAGECDVAEACNGTSLNCPADQFTPAGTICSGGSCQNGACVANCTTPATCPAPPASQLCAQATCVSGQCGFGPKPANTVCRAATGECDLAAVCDGVTLSCPANPLKPANTPCANDGNICTRDICNGSSATCTHPPEPFGTPCTSDAQPICTQDICNGAGACTHPAVTNGTNCGTNQQCCAGTCCGPAEGCKFGTTCCLGTGRSCSATVPCCGSCVLGLCV